MDKKKTLAIFVVYYLPVFLWMGLIFYLSSIPGLKSGSGSISTEIFLRKSAHMIEYLVLSFLVGRLSFYCWGLSLKKSVFLSFVFCFLYAISDEFHQFFVENRAGKALDVFIDSMGILIGIILFIVVSGIKKIK